MSIPATGAPLLGEPLPVDFMNTIWADRAGIHDALATDEDVLGWLRSVRPRLDLPDGGIDGWLDRPIGKDLAESAHLLRALRDALRRLAAEETGDSRESARSRTRDFVEALRVLNTSAAAGPHWNRLTWQPGTDATHRRQTLAAPGPALTAIIAEQGIRLFASDIRADIRACFAPGCVLYFVKQHARREWCSTACGNRARAARHYERHHGQVKATADGRRGQRAGSQDQK